MRGIHTHTLKSNPLSLHVRGYQFVVRANFNSMKGWHCTRVECREGEYSQTEDDKKYADNDDERFFETKESDDDEDPHENNEDDGEEDDNDVGKFTELNGLKYYDVHLT